MACDFLTVDTVFFSRLYVLVFIEHARRVRILGRVDDAAWYWLISPPRISCRGMLAIVAGFGGINATGMGGRNARPRCGRCSL